MSKTSSSPAKTARAAAPKAETGQKIDAGLVRQIADMLSESDLTEIEVEKGDLRIRVSRQATLIAAGPSYPQPQAFAAPAAAPAAPVAAAAPDHADSLKSPMVGTVYLRPSPDSKPFVEVGSLVASGQKVLLVEAMKTFNDIVAHRSGVVTAVLVEDGQPVEFGQPLLVIA
jgi:acetyl-CoA carboxylase biotin carboxyl carrier protein